MEDTVADVIDLEAYRELLRIGLYMEWRQTLDNDVPFKADVYEHFNTMKAEPLDAESIASLRMFFGIGMDTFHSPK